MASQRSMLMFVDEISKRPTPKASQSSRRPVVLGLVAAHASRPLQLNRPSTRIPLHLLSSNAFGDSSHVRLFSTSSPAQLRIKIGPSRKFLKDKSRQLRVKFEEGEAFRRVEGHDVLRSNIGFLTQPRVQTGEGAELAKRQIVSPELSQRLKHQYQSITQHKRENTGSLNDGSGKDVLYDESNAEEALVKRLRRESASEVVSATDSIAAERESEVLDLILGNQEVASRTQKDKRVAALDRIRSLTLKIQQTTEQEWYEEEIIEEEPEEEDLIEEPSAPTIRRHHAMGKLNRRRAAALKGKSELSLDLKGVIFEEISHGQIGASERCEEVAERTSERTRAVKQRIAARQNETRLAREDVSFDGDLGDRIEGFELSRDAATEMAAGASDDLARTSNASSTTRQLQPPHVEGRNRVKLGELPNDDLMGDVAVQELRSEKTDVTASTVVKQMLKMAEKLSAALDDPSSTGYRGMGHDLKSLDKSRSGLTLTAEQQVSWQEAYCILQELLYKLRHRRRTTGIDPPSVKASSRGRSLITRGSSDRSNSRQYGPVSLHMSAARTPRSIAGTGHQRNLHTSHKVLHTHDSEKSNSTRDTASGSGKRREHAGFENIERESISQRDGPSQSLTHVNEAGAAHMVSIASKTTTSRVATAINRIDFSEPDTHDLVTSNALKKGDVLSVARIAGIMAAKETPRLIPLCHPISLSHVSVDFEVFGPSTENYSQGRQSQLSRSREGGVRIEARCECSGQTGVEMEALTAATVAGLTVYDMCKAVDKGMSLGPAMVVQKSGGKSGDWQTPGWKSLDSLRKSH